MKTYLAIVAVVAIIGGLITWAIIASNRWEHRCNEAGGTVVSEYAGDIITYQYTYDAKGNMTGMYPVITPQYNNYCIVNGQSVEV